MLGLLIAGATLLGAGANINASAKNDEAIRKNNEAQEIIADAKRSAETAQNQCRCSMSQLARIKAEILKGTMRRFVKAYSKVGKVNFNDSEGKMELTVFNDTELSNMQYLCTYVDKSQMNAVVSGASGTLLAVGAADFVAGGALLGQVSIAGTAVAGSAVLGAVAAPVFAISGLAANSEASANLERANANLNKAFAYEEKCETYRVVADGISRRCDMFSEALDGINAEWFEKAVSEVERIVKSKNTFQDKWKKLTRQKNYTREEMAVIGSAAALAKTIKTLIDTEIVNSSGDVTQESETVICAIQGKIDEGQIPVKIDELREIQTQQAERIAIAQKNRPSKASMILSKIADKLSKIMGWVIILAIIAGVIFGVIWCGGKVVHFVGGIFATSQDKQKIEQELQNTDIGITALAKDDIDINLELTSKQFSKKYKKYTRKIMGKVGKKKKPAESLLKKYFYGEYGDAYKINSRFFYNSNSDTVYRYRVHQVYTKGRKKYAVIELEKNHLNVFVVSKNKKGEYEGALHSFEDVYDVYNKKGTYSKQQILPKSSYVKLKSKKLAHMGKNQLRTARNEIYARHGRLFKDKKLQKYFMKKKWYYGYIAPNQFTDDMLNKIEQYNVNMILKHEQK